MNLKYFCLTLLTFALLSNCVPKVQSSKILVTFPYPGKSHFMMKNALIEELIKKGHEVTAITGLSLNHLQLGHNYTEILIEPVYDFWKDVMELNNADSLFELTRMTYFDFLAMMNVIGLKTTEYALQQPEVQKLINASPVDSKGRRRFDLLLSEQFYHDAFLAFAYKYNIPVITSSTLGYENYMSQMMGFVTPWSFVPHGFMPLTDQMSFFERLQNSFYSLYEDFDREFIYFPQMDDLVRKYFSHLPVQIPSVSQMEKNISLILLNSYVPLTTPRPTVDSMIPVGGLHIYPPKKLPTDIASFMDEATHGVIYFSLGSNVQSKDMPIEKLEVFLDVFSSLKQRVLWKFENESLPDLPENVMVKKWMPQSDILAHPNVKVFITHGGLFGTQEGVHYAIPMLGIPVYCDQHVNMNKAVKGGYGLSLFFQSITRDILKNALLQLLQNPRFKQNVQRVSEVFRDRPMQARETAIYWIEYIIRHKGAKHLRSAGMELKWYQFYLLDVFAFVAISVSLMVLLLLFAVHFLLRSIRRRPIKKKQH